MVERVLGVTLEVVNDEGYVDFTKKPAMTYHGWFLNCC